MRLPQETIEQIRDMRRQGSTYEEIGARFKVSRATISKYARGLHNHKALTEDAIERLKTMRKEGASVRRIAEVTGYALSTVSRYTYTGEPNAKDNQLSLWFDLSVGCRVCNGDIILRIRREGMALEWREDAQSVVCPSCNTCFHVSDLMPSMPKIAFVY